MPAPAMSSASIERPAWGHARPMHGGSIFSPRLQKTSPQRSCAAPSHVSEGLAPLSQYLRAPRPPWSLALSARSGTAAPTQSAAVALQRQANHGWPIPGHEFIFRSSQAARRTRCRRVKLLAPGRQLAQRQSQGPRRTHAWTRLLSVLVKLTPQPQLL